MRFDDVLVLCGPDLEPFQCASFEAQGDTIKQIQKTALVSVCDGAKRVIIPGLYNSHTHMGDSFLPDGTTGMTLEEGFFRPNGYKYRQLKAAKRPAHLEAICDHLHYMASSGTVCHIDFREQGEYGVDLLREASDITGVDSIILGQFAELPFDDAELAASSKPLSESDLAELRHILQKANGFSESTMNDLTNPAWQQIRELTTELGKLRAIHCLENEGYRDVSLKHTGRGDLMRAIELLDPHLIIHLTVANAEEIELLAQHGKTGVLNPRANANLALPLPPINELLNAGINLLLGTDNGLLNSPNMFAELDYTYKLTKSQFGDPRKPDPAAILKMATSNVRPALGGDHYGYLETGLPASFVVLDFGAPHLKRSRHLLASILTRVTPAEVLETYRLGKRIA